MDRRYRFVWLDVFSRSPLEGNQLAVFPDAHGLSDAEMQAIARETHLSETTFVFPEGDAIDRERGYRTRIFAVAGEMPFAGHPTLGTASVLAAGSGLAEIALALPVGRIPVRFSTRDGLPFGEMVQNDPVVGKVHAADAVARALGVPPEAIDAELPIQTVSTGVPFVIVPFRSLADLRRARPVSASMEPYLESVGAKHFYLVARETVDPSATLHARMIFSGGEDPATGSAAGPAAAWLVLHGRVPPDRSILIEQGLEVQRPSRLYARAGLRDGAPVDVRVGGHCVSVIEGEIRL